MRIQLIVLAGAAALAGGASRGANHMASMPGSELVTNVTACRKIVDPAARLSCYDGNVDKLAAADDKGGLVVLSRDDVHAARRSLFGFNVPRLPFLESKDKDEPVKTREAESEIDSTIRTARQRDANDWVIVLADAATWETSESPNIDPRAGDPIKIRRAALGSYLANINGQRAVRIRRIG